MDGLVPKNEKRSEADSIESGEAIKVLNDSPPVMKSKNPNSKEKTFQKKK